MIKVIEKYGATWCGPCNALDKTLKELMPNYPNIDLVKFDADEDEDKFDEKGIKEVPQIFFYNEDGVEVHHLTGAFPLEKLKDIIDYHNKTIDTYNPDAYNE